VAEWLRSGLQSRLHRFDSGRRLLYASPTNPPRSRRSAHARILEIISPTGFAGLIAELVDPSARPDPGCTPADSRRASTGPAGRRETGSTDRYATSVLVRRLLAMTVLGFALASASASASSLPPLIAFQTREGVGVVQPSHPSTERMIAIPGRTPAWSPNGEVLAYTPEGRQIVLLDRNARRIAAFPVSLAYELSWSPDGRQIAHLCRIGPIYEEPPIPGLAETHTTGVNVCVLDVISGTDRVLAASNSEFFIGGQFTGALSWSAKGDVIALDVLHNTKCPFTETNPVLVNCGDPEIGTISTTTGAWARFTTFSAYTPAFSPNGLEIVYNDFKNGLTVASASGANARHLGISIGTGGPWPAWSPDSKGIVFSSKAPPANNGNNDLFEIAATGGPLKQITNTPEDETYASWAQALTVCSVPKLKGQTLSAAKRLLQLAGCKLGSIGGPKSGRAKRKITTQSPGANRNVSIGTKVNVKLA
jgi:hypothetical protein